MSDDNQSNTPIQPVSTAARAPSYPAPMIPVAGAILSAPLTGQGPHMVPEDKRDTVAQNTPPAPGVVEHPNRPPPLTPPRRPVGVAATPIASDHGPVFGTATAVHLNGGNHQQPEFIDPAMTSLITRFLNNQRQAAQQFHLLILPDDGWPSIETFDDVNQLIERIKGLLGTPVCLCPFLGYKLSITEGPNRFLMTPMGSLRLFDIPDPEQIPATRYGWVGPSLDTPQPPMDDTDPADDVVTDVPIVESNAPAEELPEPAPDSSGNTPIFDN